MAETKNGTVISGRELLKLAGALNELLYGEMSTDGAMKLLRTTLKAHKRGEEIEAAQKRVIEGFRTEEYKSLSDKVNNNTATDEEKDEFERLNRIAVPKSNEMIDQILNAEETLDIEKISEEDFQKLCEANKKKITNGGFVTIYKWLC